jgi:hypothetical protein
MSRKLVSPDTLKQYGITIRERQRRRLEKAGRFPRRVHPTPHAHAYVEDEILAHIELCIRERDAAERETPSRAA